MKAPITTHGLLLLAESKLSCMNVRNSDKRTQTIGIVVTMRINHGEHLPKHLGCSSLESDLIKSSLISTTMREKGRGYRSGKERKRKVQRLNINAIKLNHRYTGWLSLSKGILKANFIPRRLYVSQLRQLSVWIFIIILNIKQKHKNLGRNSRKEMTPITYFPPPGFGAGIGSLLLRLWPAFILINGTRSLNMHSPELPGWFSSLTSNAVDEKGVHFAKNSTSVSQEPPRLCRLLVKT